MINSDAAIAYAQMGWAVFPIASGRKNPLTEHGFHDATTDVAIIRRWWERWPDASIGIATGERSGFWALDVDRKKNGDKTLAALLAYHGAFEPTVIARTGGGGQHYLFNWPGQRVKNSVESLGDGLDVRGDGGYIVVPPSIHESGNRYLWETAPSEEMIGAPEWLLRQVLSPVRPSAPSVRSAVSGNPLLSSEPIGEGGRNHTLARIAGIMRANGASQEDIYASLLGVNATRCRPPLPDSELQTIAASIAKYEAGPDLIAEPFDGTDVPVSEPAIPHYERPPEETDLGNAKRFRARHGALMRYVTSWEKWLVWTGTHWQTDNTSEADRRCIETVEAIKSEAGTVQKELDRVAEELQSETQKSIDNNQADASRLKSLRRSSEILEARAASLYKHARDSQSERSLRAMRRIAATLPEIAMTSTQLDAQPFLLNVANGTLDLRTGILRAHDPADLITRCTSVQYDPLAECPRWLAFLTEIMLDNGSLVEYLQRAIGYTLTGSVTAQVLFFMHGHGQNGKSTVINVLQEIFGAYAGTGAPTLLEEGDRHPTEIANLCNKRMVMISEPEDNRALPAAQIKRLTSEEVITARRMREDFWEFVPSHKLWISGNHKPTVRGTDLGIWRRIQLIPFSYTVPEHKKDSTLKDTLVKELPGILAWAVRGCAAWLAGGLQPPEAVIQATQDYRDEEDVVGNFLDDSCERGPGFTVPSGQLFGAYVTWCETNGFKEGNSTKFAQRLEGAGIQRARNKNQRFFVGVRIKPTGLQEAK